jgi:hypothetical protein
MLRFQRVFVSVLSMMVFAATTYAAPAVRSDRAAMQSEMQARLLQSHQQVALLQQRYDATTDAELREALQLHIEAAKREGQLDLFRIQLRHAQANGRTDDAKEIQAILERAALEKRAPLPALPAEVLRAVPAPKVTKAVSK